MDGETNLKVRQSDSGTVKILGTDKTGITENISGVTGRLNCEEPNKKLYDFKGSLTIKAKSSQNEAPLRKG